MVILLLLLLPADAGLLWLTWAAHEYKGLTARPWDSGEGSPLLVAAGLVLLCAALMATTRVWARVTLRAFEHLPQRCACGHQFDGSEEPAGDPVCHQQLELAPIRPLVFEPQRVRLVCPNCLTATLAELSAGALSGFGPRVDAHIAMLAGVFRLSGDQVRQIVVEVFGIPASKGSIDNAIMRMSAILADPWAELREAIGKAQVVHADETTWRLRGAQQWLWVAASSLVACFRIEPTRSQRAAKELLGEDFGGFVVSDRYAGSTSSTSSNNSSAGVM